MHGKRQNNQEQEQTTWHGNMAEPVTKLKADVRQNGVETDLMLEEVPSGQ